MVSNPWGGLKADISEAFRPTGDGGAGAEPPLTIILIKSHLTVRRPLGSLTRETLLVLTTKIIKSHLMFTKCF